ncbi:hypothetical protein F5Y03DRAFT_405039 [Xylaria venustula]|nr:hypothetical protein F5Y03DRAFT_405039 [Xylaria venustula]
MDTLKVLKIPSFRDRLELLDLAAERGAAVKDGDVSLVHALLLNEQHINKPEWFANQYSPDTPLSLAIRGKKYQVVDLLMSSGALKNFPSRRAFRAAWDAAEETENQVVLDKIGQLCLETGEKQSGKDQYWGIWIAYKTGNYQLVKELLPDQDADACEDLLEAVIRNNDIGLFNLFLDSTAWVSDDLLTGAADWKQTLTAPGAVKNGMTALVGAASQGRIDIVAILLNKGAGRGEDGKKQFEKAIAAAEEYGHYPTSDCLKERWEAQGREDFAQQPDPVEEFMNFCDED